jgi:hypothetical protein
MSLITNIFTYITIIYIKCFKNDLVHKIKSMIQLQKNSYDKSLECFLHANKIYKNDIWHNEMTKQKLMLFSVKQ